MKKLLALVLALVMVFSLCTVTNAAYPDDAAIDYDEAVEVMSAVGVFQGDEKGYFNPDDTLTREQAAKIVTYMMLGKKNGDTLVAIAAPYADVEATRWSAGSIAYCTNEGILAGIGNNLFAPTDKLTGLAFAKMLLVALGYDPEIEGLVGETWAINVAKIALQIGLTEDLDNITLSAPLTREQAAQMAFNAETAIMVEYLGNTVVTAGDVTVQTQTAASQVRNNSGTGYMTPAVENDNLLQFCEKYAKKLKLDTTEAEDEFARPASTWVYDEEEIDTVADDATYTFTGKTQGKDLYAKVGKNAVEKFDWFFYLNGVENDDADVEDVTKTSKTDFAKAGDMTYVYVDSEEKEVTVCTIKTYVGEVKTVKAAKGNDNAYVLIDSLGDAAFSGEKYETESFEKEDVVLFTFSEKEDKIESVKLAEEITGNYTQVKDKTNFVLGGTTYSYSDDMKDSERLETPASYDKDDEHEILFYTDGQGNCIYIGEVKVDTTYAVIVDAGENSGYWVTEGYDYKCKLLLTDGTTKVVDVKTVKDEGNELDFDPDMIGEIVKYSVNKKGEYTLTLVSTYYDEVETTKGVSKITDGADSSPATVGYADDDTVVLVGKVGSNGKATYTAYEGVKNMPSFLAGGSDFYDALDNADDGYSYATAYVSDTNMVKVLFVLNADFTATSTDAEAYIYALADDAKVIRNDDGYYYEADAVIDGEVVTMKIAEGSDAADKLMSSPFGAIVGAIAEDDDGFVEDFDYVDIEDDDVVEGVGETKAITKSVVSLDGVRYTVSADLQVVIVDEDGELSAASTVPSEDTAYFAGYTVNGKLAYIVIFEGVE